MHVHFSYSLVTDSYYTHRMLAEELLNRSTYLIGTLRGINLAGLPPVITDKNSQLAKKLLRGQRIFLHMGKCVLHLVSTFTSCMYITFRKPSPDSGLLEG